MKNLRKAIGVTTALLLVFVTGGCGQGSNAPGTANGNTGNALIGTGTAIVPGTSAIGTTNGMNNGVAPGNGLRNNAGVNPGTRLGNTVRNDLGLNPGNNNRTNYGTNLGANPGTGNIPGLSGTTGNGYKDGSYSASCDSSTGTEIATVTINNGRIGKVVLQSLNSAGNGTANLNGAKNDIIQQVISRQNADIGSIRGMQARTGTTERNWVTAVKRALDKARA